uniref:Uncharacterized protein n=2 Tax=Photinus pyralis TaxID=7054 RepID=A0A1Y1N784_PHOPY
MGGTVVLGLAVKVDVVDFVAATVDGLVCLTVVGDGFGGAGFGAGLAAKGRVLVGVNFVAVTLVGLNFSGAALAVGVVFVAVNAGFFARGLTSPFAIGFFSATLLGGFTSFGVSLPPKVLLTADAVFGGAGFVGAVVFAGCAFAAGAALGASFVAEILAGVFFDAAAATAVAGFAFSTTRSIRAAGATSTSSDLLSCDGVVTVCTGNSGAMISDLISRVTFCVSSPLSGDAMSGMRDLSMKEFTSVVAMDSVSAIDFGESDMWGMVSRISVGDARGKGESFTDEVMSSTGESSWGESVDRVGSRRGD